MDEQRDENVASAVTLSADQYGEAGVAVATAVALASEHDPLQLPPLSTAGVDADALDAIVETNRDPTMELSFEYVGHAVSLYGDGTLRVVPVDA